MAKIGVDKLFFAELDELTDILDGKPTYKTPFQIAKAIQITLTPQNIEGNLAADDTMAEYDSATVAYDVSVNVDDLLPGSESKLFGRKVDDLGGVITNKEDEAPYGALLYRQKRSKGVGGGYQYRRVNKVRFVPFAEDAQTQGESINYQTPTITGKSLALTANGDFNYKLDDDGTKPAVSAITKEWFKRVVDPNEIPEG